MKTLIKSFQLLLFVISTQLMSQNEFSKWYFGLQAGLDFSTSPPTVLTNGAINTGEGVATMCDSGGNLLITTDGTGVGNANNTLMANGAGLFGNSSTSQSGIIVKQPGNANIYYIFTLAATSAPAGACYSIVDMNLAAGLGSVTVKNATLYTPSCEKQVAVRHCNGKDVWIVSHEYNSNNFRAYLLTSSGINPTPVITPIGETPGGTGTGISVTAIGQLKISPDGRKLAMTSASLSNPTSLGVGGFHLFDFDAATGVVSNSLALNSTNASYGIEFSGDGKILYGATSPPSGIGAKLFQWNICGTNTAAIVASEYSVNLGNVIAGSLQRAIDNKIYLAVTGSQSLHVINNPNASGAAMNFVLNGQSIAPKMSFLGLPNYINLYTKPTPTPFTNTIACQNVSFAVPPVPTFSSGCSSTPYAPNGYVWDFGDPASGAANTSTLANPQHNYSSTGTYTASLILINPCVNDTIRQAISITTPGPSVTVTGTMSICKGEKRTYTAAGGNSYVWHNNSTASTIALSPTTTTVYSVTGTANGCSTTKQFTVTVSPCTGISNRSGTLSGVEVYPNPVNEKLFVESSTQNTLFIYDVNGKLVLESKLSAGLNEINTGNLSRGVYTLRCSGNWHGKLVKVE